jgi:hypothetical protein
VHSTDQRFEMPLVGDSLFEPEELLRAEVHGNGLAFDPSGPLVTRSAPPGTFLSTTLPKAIQPVRPS